MKIKLKLWKSCLTLRTLNPLCVCVCVEWGKGSLGVLTWNHLEYWHEILAPVYTPTLLYAYYITKKVFALRINLILSFSSNVLNFVRHWKKVKSIFPWQDTNFPFQIFLLDFSYFKSSCAHISYESNTQALWVSRCNINTLCLSQLECITFIAILTNVIFEETHFFIC